MLGKAGHRWRIGESRFEWQNTKCKCCDCKRSAALSSCCCEYSKVLGKVGHRWRVGESRFEWQNMKCKSCDCKRSAASSLCWRSYSRKSSLQTKEIVVVLGISKKKVRHIIGDLGFRKLWWVCQASHEYNSKRYNSRSGISSAAASTV
jgi:hypothetical protein